ncbi:hypothetical protein HZS_427, partial [Henneguya salminicola]
MYNGVGLPTPRGSGTSGYVQKNLSFVGNKTYHQLCYERDPSKAKTDALCKKVDPGIQEHEKKREVEIKCIELKDMLEEQGYPADEIDSKVNEFRQALLERQKEEGNKNSVENQQILSQYDDVKNQKMKSALGIRSDYIEGSAFNFEEKKKIAETEKISRDLRKEKKKEEIKKLEKALKQQEKQERTRKPREKKREKSSKDRHPHTHR